MITTHVEEEIRSKILEVHLQGKLDREDYQKFVPDTERMIREHGKIRILVTMHDFHGWDASGLWEDIKWDAKHFSDIERLAIVGETSWHKWMANFCKAFTTAKIRYFAPDQAEQAKVWLAEA